MDIQRVITRRSFQTWPSFDLVHEWEDVFREGLNARFLYKNRLADTLERKLPLLCSILHTSQNCFEFEMNPSLINRQAINKKNIIPCIIDFFLKDIDLPAFYKAYDKNPVVCISNNEVMEYLNKHNSPLTIKHLPLSIPDKYKIYPHTHFTKKYDLVMMGRQNKILEGFVKEYAVRHKDFIFVYRKLEDNRFLYYASDGELLGNINTRDQYMGLMRQSRVGLYSTPGMDEGAARTNGFNQVTPRFLELIACGCHIIARYKENADTEFYNLKNFSNPIDTYHDFELALDYARNHEVDMETYSMYLLQHYTSQRVKLLKDITSGL